MTGLVDPQHAANLLARHARERTSPATRWADGVPLGNGRVGAVVWGNGSPLVLTLDHTGNWDRRGDTPEIAPLDQFLEALAGRPSSWPASWPVHMPRFDIVTPTRLPPSRLLLHGLGAVEGMTHDLASAAVEVRCSAGSCTVSVLAEHDVVLVRGSGAVPQVELHWLSDPITWESRVGGQPGFAPHPSALFADHPAPLRVQSDDGECVGHSVPDGSAVGAAWSLDDGEDGWTLLVSLASLRNGADADAASAAEEILRSVSADMDGAVATHRAFWQQFHSRSWVSVPTPSVESLWFAEMAKLGSAVRADGPPLGLQGPWSPDGRMPPWGGDLHHNVNVQFSYAPCAVTNHGELLESLQHYVSTALPEWSMLSNALFGVDGFFVPSATDDEGRCRYEWAMVNLAFSSGPWLAQVLHTGWRHSGDDAFRVGVLAPFMRGLAAPLLDRLELGDDGRLHVPFGYSPELVPNGQAWGRDPNIDLALLGWLFDALVELEELEGHDATRWREASALLAPLPADVSFGVMAGVLTGRDGGLRVRADAPLERSHRHHSHLMAIHPLRRVTASNPATRDLAAASLRSLMLSGPGEWVGFSAPWAASIAALAGDGDVALGHLCDYAERWVGPSTFHVQASVRGEVPTVWNELGAAMGGDALSLEAGFAFVAAVADLLLHDHDGVVSVFPALPSAWPDAAFAGLRAAGGFEVAAQAAAGCAVSVSVLAHRDAELVLQFPADAGRVEVRRSMLAGERFDWLSPS